MKNKICILTMTVICAFLLGCGEAKNQTQAEENTQITETHVIAPETYEFPDGIDLSEETLTNLTVSYADYLTKALESEGCKANVRTTDDDVVHFDGIRLDENGEEQTEPDLKVFKTKKDFFAYLYQLKQVDESGNLLVSVNDNLIDQVKEESQKHQTEATSSSKEKERSQ